jgi:hypothetical protein
LGSGQAYFVDTGTEMCGYCGRMHMPIWHADDALYNEVTECVISCILCFTLLCEAKGINLVWRPVRDEDSVTEKGEWSW